MSQSYSGESRSITVFGSGYVGGALVRQALGRGFRVSALTRNPSTAARLGESGRVNVVCADLESDAWHDRIPRKQDFVVNCVSSGGAGIEGYRRSYVGGQDSLNRWLCGGGASVLVYTGSIGVYPQDDGSVVDEGARVGGHSEYADLLVQTEENVLKAPLPAERRYVLRLAGIYGPGRHSLLDRILAGNRLIPGSENGVMNAIHLDDVCGAVWAVIDGARDGTDGVYNVVDDFPEKRTVVAEWLAGKLGRTVPGFEAGGGGRRPGKRSGRPRNRKISNEKLRKTFSWRPVYPSYREGYAAILRNPQYRF